MMYGLIYMIKRTKRKKFYCPLCKKQSPLFFFCAGYHFVRAKYEEKNPYESSPENIKK